MKELRDSLSFLFPKPSPVELIRIGGNADGAYLIPNDVDGICACFSPGVANFKSFEDELLERYGIRSHMVDFSSDEGHFRTPLRVGSQTFRKLWLDDSVTSNSITLDQWVKEEEPGSGDLLLQMDIEGAEYRNLMSVSKETLRRFRIIVVELHGLAVQHSRGFLEETVVPLLLRLQEEFVCVHAHPNNVGGCERLDGVGLEVPRVLEVTLLRKDRFGCRTEPSMILPMIPHPLDISVNTPDCPPLVLSEEWCYGNIRCPTSRDKMRSLYTDYAGSCLELVFERLDTLERENLSLRRRLAELSLFSRCAKYVRQLRESLRFN
ncbi:MAG: hypothetical protein RLZZ536_1907 [Planctomycetota bacterium]